jgi:hypothetical protein
LNRQQTASTISADGKVTTSGSLIVFQGTQTMVSNGAVSVRGNLAAFQMPSVIYGIGRVGAEQTRVILMA